MTKITFYSDPGCRVTRAINLDPFARLGLSSRRDRLVALGEVLARIAAWAGGPLRVRWRGERLDVSDVRAMRRRARAARRYIAAVPAAADVTWAVQPGRKGGIELLVAWELSTATGVQTGGAQLHIVEAKCSGRLRNNPG